jgi:integrase
MKITLRAVQKYHGKFQDKMLFLRDSDLKGFGVRVSPKGAVSFICEGRIKGQGGSPKRITIGKYPAFTVDQAREVAKEYLREMYQGNDPLKVKKEKVDISQEADGYTLEKVFGEFIARRDLKETTQKDYRQVISFVYGDYLKKPVRDITRKVIEDTFFSLKSKGTAGKSSRVLSAVLNYAKGIELSNGERLLLENPVDVLKDKGVKRTLKRRQTVVSPEDLVQILGRLQNALERGGRLRHNPSTLMAIYLIALTGCRKQEILRLKKENVHDDHFVIKDTKNHLEHVVPVTEAVRWVLETAKNNDKDSLWMFPSNRNRMNPVFNPAKVTKYYLKAFTLHDLRRTFITVASEIGVDFNSIKMLVNHKSSDVTNGYIIQRVEQRLPRLKELYTQVQMEMLSSEHLPSAEELFKPRA